MKYKMYDNMEDLKKIIQNCNRCKLCSRRKNIVFGDGNENADIMFIGEGPGGDEDIKGIPFVGKAGQLMDKAFEAVGLDRKKVYIANIVKCRPPNNRDPEKDEIDQCINFLRNQAVIVKPKIIVLLGRVALQNILGQEYKITASRGIWQEKKSILYMPTWHPAALLRDENKKIEFLKDLKEVLKKYNEINLTAL